MTLPNFIIAGAMKAGTTSLHEYLGQHPQVYTSPIKETRYFTFDPENPDHVNKSYRNFPVRTMDAYLAQFDGVKDEVAVGEATPNYLISPLAPARISKIIPDVRLIFSLRHPVDRVYSIYTMAIMRGTVSGDVYEDLAPGGEITEFHRYAPYFEHWLKFFDSSGMKIILFEDFKSDPVGITQSIFDYLEVDDSFVPDISRQYNVSGVPKNKVAGNFARTLNTVRNLPFFRKYKTYLPASIRSWNNKLRKAALRKPDPLPPDLAHALEAYYREDVLKLQELLEIDLTPWGFV